MSSKLLLVVAIGLFTLFISYFQLVLAEPTFTDPSLKAELVVEGLSSPTSMAFVDSSNILVLEKNNGEVRLVSNGLLQEKPVLKVDVDNTTLTCCRGLLGIATLSQGINTEVFIYFSEAAKDDSPVRNKVYKYGWDGYSLVNPKLLLDLPAEPGPNHPAGKIAMGKDGFLYTAIGDLNNEGKLQNIADGPDPSDTSVILKISPHDGSAPVDNPFANAAKSYPKSQMDKYYGYGIRNSFGLAIDPVTGFLWETENGDKDYDEINLVKPGFDGGWKRLMGPISKSDVTKDGLVIFPAGHYGDPVFSWSPSLGVTDIEFLSSHKLGLGYENNVFVGDIVNGNLYYFRVNDDRTGLVFDNPKIQGDLVANDDDELKGITLGTGFEGITDIETGPDGFLYVLTFDEKKDGEGKIYKVLPSSGEGVLD
jgi:glucose/arabinose dehydrogenase